MPEGNSKLGEVLVTEIRQDLTIDVVVGEHIAIAAEADTLKPLPKVVHILRERNTARLLLQGAVNVAGI